MATLTKPQTWAKPTKKQLVMAALEGKRPTYEWLAAELNNQFDRIMMQLDALKYPLEGGKNE